MDVGGVRCKGENWGMSVGHTACAKRRTIKFLELCFSCLKSM